MSTQKTNHDEAIGNMFDQIAPSYDFLNHWLSFGVDKYWRSKIIKIIKKSKGTEILDIATGTADLAINAAIKIKNSNITGIDISKQMLEIGKFKIDKLKLSKRINLQQQSGEQMTFADNSFDVVTIAFGIRNFGNCQKGLDEMYRVLKPGGTIAVLEFSKPKSWLFAKLYYFYFKNILPLFGKLVSKHSSAYNYLPNSVMNFAEGEEFLTMMNKANFVSSKQIKLTQGISSIYTAHKQ